MGQPEVQAKPLSDYIALFVWRRREDTTSIEVLLQSLEDGRGWWFPCMATELDVTFTCEQLDENFVKERIGLTGKVRAVRRIREYHYIRVGFRHVKSMVIILDLEAELRLEEQDSLAHSRWMTMAEMEELDIFKEPLLNSEPLQFLGEIGISNNSNAGVLQSFLSPQSLEAITLKMPPKAINHWGLTDSTSTPAASLIPELNEAGIFMSLVHTNFVKHCWPGYEMTFPVFEGLFSTACGNSQTVKDLWKMVNSERSRTLPFFDYVNTLAFFDATLHSQHAEVLFDVKSRMLFRCYGKWSNELNQDVLAAADSSHVLAKILPPQKMDEFSKNTGVDVTLDVFRTLIKTYFKEYFNKFLFDLNTSAMPKLNELPRADSKRIRDPVEEVEAIHSLLQQKGTELKGEQLDKFIGVLDAIRRQMGLVPPPASAASLKQISGPNSRRRQTRVLLQNRIVRLKKGSHHYSVDSVPTPSLSGDNYKIAVNGATEDSNHLPREILNLLHDYLVEERIPSSHASVSLHSFVFKWKTTTSHQQFLQYLPQLVDLCEPLFASENRLLNLESPCYIMGDFHGNFHDLSTLAHFLWPQGPSLCPAKLLCMGDYVDRGPNALELLGYLLAQKLLSPDKIFLLRGNHDDPRINVDFRSSCSESTIAAYGSFQAEDVAKRIWFHINRLFAVLPVAAVIDNSIFCSHSGILSPRTASGGRIDKINDAAVVPLRLASVLDNSVTVELGWNDPLLPEHAKSVEVTQDLARNRDGFAVNIQRSTQGERNDGILYWTPMAFQTFMTTNTLQFFVRAQEAFRREAIMVKEPRILTVTCSEAGYNATVVSAERGSLKIIEMDTQNMVCDLRGGMQEKQPSYFQPMKSTGSKSAVQFDEAAKVSNSCFIREQ